jgi:hypothetical protein
VHVRRLISTSSYARLTHADSYASMYARVPSAMLARGRAEGAGTLFLRLKIGHGTMCVTCPPPHFSTRA